MVSPEQNILILLTEIEKRDKIIKAKNVIIKEYESIVCSYKELVDKIDKTIDEKIIIIGLLTENSDSQYQTAFSLIKKLKELQETINNLRKLNLN